MDDLAARNQKKRLPRRGRSKQGRGPADREDGKQMPDSQPSMNCNHRFGHPSLADDDCLPCDGVHEPEFHTDGETTEWTEDHPWDRVVEATEPTVFERAVDVLAGDSGLTADRLFHRNVDVSAVVGALLQAGLLVSEPEKEKT